jgi:ribose transport system substrate-binding protein
MSATPTARRGGGNGMKTLKAATLLLLALAVGCGESTTPPPVVADSGVPSDANQETSPFRPLALEAASRALTALIATSTSDPSRTPIGMVTNSASPVWNAFQIGVGRAGSKIGCPVSVALLTATSNRPDAQAAMVQALIDQKYPGIAASPSTASPADETRFASMVDAQKAQGNTVLFDSDLPSSGRALYVGADNYKAGLAHGAEVVRVLAGKGGKVFPMSSVNSDAIRERLRGLQDAIAAHPGILLQPLQVGADATAVQGLAAATMNDHPDIALFAGLSNGGTVGPANAVVAAGKTGNILIVGYDATSQNQQFLKTGVISALVGQRFYWEGFLVTQALYAMAQPTLGLARTLETLRPWLSGSKMDMIDLGIDVLTAENLPAYLQYLESIGILSQ